MKKFVKILALYMLVVMVAMTFASCGIFNNLFGKEEQEREFSLESAQEYLDDNGYFAWIEENEECRILTAGNGNDELFYAYEYETEAIAEEKYTQCVEYDFVEIKQNASEQGIEIDYGRYENIIYYGTPNAIDIAFGK